MSTNRQTAQQAYDAFAQGDISVVLGALSPQVHWRVPASLPFEDQIGAEAVAQNIFAVLPTLFDGYALEVAEVLDAGEDAVVAVGVYHGTGRRTGRRLDADFIHFWRFGPDGKVTFFRSYTDTHLWLQALGTDQEPAVPAQAGAPTAAPSPAS